MQQESQTYTLIKWCVIAIDLLVLNALLTAFVYLYPSFIPEGMQGKIRLVYFIFNIVYLCYVSIKGLILQMRKVRPEQIVGRVFTFLIGYAVLSFLSVNALCTERFSWKPALLF